MQTFAQNFAFMPEVFKDSEHGGIWVIKNSSNNLEEVCKSPNYNTFGCLYTFDKAQELCPEGWRLPSDDDWKQFERNIGMEEKYLDEFNREGDKTAPELICNNLFLWKDTFPVLDKNTYDFAVLPGGISLDYGYDRFTGFKGKNAYFWSATTYLNNEKKAVMRSIDYTSPIFKRKITLKTCGLSVRYVKDI